MALMLSSSASGGRALRGRSGRFNERKKISCFSPEKNTFGPRRYLNARSAEGCWGQPVPCICRQERLGPWWVNFLFVVVFILQSTHSLCLTLLRKFSSCAHADRAAFTHRVRYSHVQLITLGLVGMCERACLLTPSEYL